MKFFAFTDTHGNWDDFARIKERAQKDDIDFLVCAGDFTIFGINQQEILEFLESIGKTVLLIHGNHEDEETVREQIQYLPHIVWLHKKKHQYKGIDFYGFGGGGFSTREPEFTKYMNEQTSKHMVLVVHQPPRNTVLDTVNSHMHVGNTDFTDFILNKKPLIVIAGHIHEASGKKQMLQNTLLVNPGPQGCVITLNEDKL